MEDILWKYSWANLMMLMASIPTYKKKESDGKEGGIEITDSDEFERLMS